MSIVLDLTGKRFGKWKVIERAENTKRGSSQWLCECGSCHRRIVVTSGNLRSGRSSACQQCVKRLPEGEASFNGLLRQYRSDAKEKHRAFTLSKKLFRSLTSSPCHYCAAEPKRLWTRGKTWGHYKYNGVDRKINTRGYTPENCVSCCKDCNFMKKDMNYQEFIDWVRRVYDCLQKRNT